MIFVQVIISNIFTSNKKLLIVKFGSKKITHGHVDKYQTFIWRTSQWAHALSRTSSSSSGSTPPPSPLFGTALGRPAQPPNLDPNPPSPLPSTSAPGRRFRPTRTIVPPHAAPTVTADLANLASLASRLSAALLRRLLSDYHPCPHTPSS